MTTDALKDVLRDELDSKPLPVIETVKTGHATEAAIDDTGLVSEVPSHPVADPSINSPANKIRRVFFGESSGFVTPYLAMGAAVAVVAILVAVALHIKSKSKP